MAYFYSSANHFKNYLILFVHQKVIMAEIKTGENASGGLDQDRTDDVSCVSSSRTK